MNAHGTPNLKGEENGWEKGHSWWQRAVVALCSTWSGFLQGPFECRAFLELFGFFFFFPNSKYHKQSTYCSWLFLLFVLTERCRETSKRTHCPNTADQHIKISVLSQANFSFSLGDPPLHKPSGLKSMASSQTAGNATELQSLPPPSESLPHNKFEKQTSS